MTQRYIINFCMNLQLSSPFNGAHQLLNCEIPVCVFACMILVRLLAKSIQKAYWFEY